ncbi:MAG TPA: DUF2752 domain-containing protein [Candidatus Gemmiger faecigallinarum]|nr:DUF2752 domain-containing protein [Candidatus Gemmiger faecigallinarum]
MRVNRPWRRVAARAALLLAAGAGYGLFAARFGGLPCPFRLATGLQCPGCGITTLLLAVGRGDFGAAFAANPFLFCTWPLPAALVLWQGWQRACGRRLGKRAETAALLYAAALLLWGAARNLPLLAAAA